MQLKRRAFHKAYMNPQVSSILIALEVDKSLYIPRRRYSGQPMGSFWNRNIDYFAVLEACHKQWLVLSKKWHPNRQGGDNEVMVIVNALWLALRKRFAFYGYTLNS